MAKPYILTPQLRMVNTVIGFLLRLGTGPKQSTLLTVRGRKSGKAYTTPVSPISQEGQEYIVSPYGEVAWVRNARVSGEVTLTRGGNARTVKIEEVKPAEAAALILKTYYQREKQYVGDYFDANADLSVEMFAAEAAQHPVFKVVSSN